MTSSSDHIDPIRLTHMSSCAGCAAKLNPSLLKEALSSLPTASHPNLLVGSDTMDDAGVYQISKDKAIITTTDFFTPIVDDPVLFGEIASCNAMSDIYAMGGEVLTALNIVSFPKDLPMSILHDILKGADQKVREAGGLIVGGHTVATDTLMFGQAITGIIDPKDLTSNDQAAPGDILILTKPLGTGIITTAVKRDVIHSEEALEAYFNMSQLNDKVAKLMREYGVKAATDVTGFGVLGHTAQMASASGVTIELIAKDIPLLNGAKDLAAKGVLTGAGTTNFEYISPMTEVKDGIDQDLFSVLLDPQTSGGLIFSIDATKGDAIVKELKASGYKETSIVGSVLSKGEKPLVLR